MGVVKGRRRSEDRNAHTFNHSGGVGGLAFQQAVADAVNGNTDLEIPEVVRPIEYSEVAELAMQQDDALFCRLINNNVNLRYSNTLGATNPTINGNLSIATLFPFNVKNFSGGGMERSVNQLYFIANKCGVYRVSFGLQFAGIGGVLATDPYITLIKTTSSIVGNPYSSVFWRGNGNLGNFWASGSDLIELGCGERISLGINNNAVGGAGISQTTYTANAWIAINYTGNQHD